MSKPKAGKAHFEGSQPRRILASVISPSAVVEKYGSSRRPRSAHARSASSPVSTVRPRVVRPGRAGDQASDLYMDELDDGLAVRRERKAPGRWRATRGKPPGETGTMNSSASRVLARSLRHAHATFSGCSTHSLVVARGAGRRRERLPGRRCLGVRGIVQSLRRVANSDPGRRSAWRVSRRSTRRTVSSQPDRRASSTKRLTAFALREGFDPVAVVVGDDEDAGALRERRHDRAGEV